MRNAGELVTTTGGSPAPQESGNKRCAAFGCPLASSITDSTKGGGVWYCRFHFQGSWADNDRITAEIREKKRRGEPLDAQGETPTVTAMKARLKAAYRRVEREPGSDDE